MMKIPVLFLLFIFLTSNLAWSQDIIAKKNGDTISAKVLKVNPDGIEYKLYNKENGPLYTMSTSEIVVIKYANGTKDIFPESPTGGNVNYSEGIYTLSERGTMDAKLYYRGGRKALIGGAISALYPGYGFIPTAIIASTRPKYESLNFPYPELMDNYEYSEAYKRKAFKIKSGKAWEGFGIATGVLASLVAAVVIGVTNH